MQHNPVGWFEIYVQDMPRAKAFYERVLAVELQKLEGTEFEMWAFPMHPDGKGASGALIHIPGCPTGGHGTMVYFTTTDCAIPAGLAAENGGEVHRAKFSIGPYGFIALVTDTEGNMIGLHSMQ